MIADSGLLSLFQKYLDNVNITQIMTLEALEIFNFVNG